MGAGIKSAIVRKSASIKNQKLPSTPLSVLALLLMMGPSGGEYLLASDLPQFPIDRSPIERTSLPPLQSVKPSIEGSSDTVTASELGLVGDGVTDNTQILRKLLSEPGKIVIIPSGHYRTGSLTVPSNTKLIMRSGVVLEDNGMLGGNERLLSIFGDHVSIEAYGAKILTANGLYSGGEQRHGVFLYGASDVIIEGLESSGHAGDGFYIGGPRGNPSTNIRLLDCSAKENWRQGISVTNATRLLVEDSEFSYTTGKKPEAGLDFEPNFVSDVLDHILVVRANTKGNMGGGILVWLGKLSNMSTPVDITIVDHFSSDEVWSIRAFGSKDVRGVLRYVSSTAH